MKFCLSVCEYDPLHSGHVRHLNAMRESGADFVAVIMSGGFTQRGGVAILDKYTRARHAVLAGADIVFELPAVFSSAPAEIFAKGAVKLLFSLGEDNALCFGAEKGSKEEFFKLAKACLNESKEFKQKLKQGLDGGEPYAKAYSDAVKATADGVNTELLDNPNCTLGLEYAKAIVESGRRMDIIPIIRGGASHSSDEIKGDFISSSAIRGAIARKTQKKIKKYLPRFVYEELPQTLPSLDAVAVYSLLTTPREELKNVIDCTEGLENRLRVVARSVTGFDELIDRLETKRYTRARLARVVTAAMLKIDRSLVSKCLKGNLYLKVLAVAKDKIEVLTEVANALASTKTTLITRKTDADGLSGIAAECFDKDIFAGDLYFLASGTRVNPYEMKIVERKKPE